MAAVSAIITHGFELLLMKRADYPGDPWSGHISFPGGRVEPSDATPLEAAKRETLEEIALDLSDAEFLGRLNDLPTIGGLPELVIRPFVFLLPELPTLHLNDEVSSTHLLPIDVLLSNEGRSVFHFTHGDNDYTLPCVDFDGQRLWGLTLLFVDDLLHRLDGSGRGLERLRS